MAKKTKKIAKPTQVNHLSYLKTRLTKLEKRMSEIEARLPADNNQQQEEITEQTQ